MMLSPTWALSRPAALLAHASTKGKHKLLASEKAFFKLLKYDLVWYAVRIQLSHDPVQLTVKIIQWAPYSGF